MLLEVPETPLMVRFPLHPVTVTGTAKSLMVVAWRVVPIDVRATVVMIFSTGRLVLGA